MFTQWEYKQVIQERFLPNPTVIAVLNKHGAEGWEVCAIIEDRAYLVIYLKRAIQNENIP